VTASTRQLEALAQADLLLLVAALLLPPGQSGREVDCDGAALDALVERARAPGRRRLTRALKNALRQRKALDAAALCSEHTRLFEGSVLCPVNESDYVRRDKGAILADICGFYRAFGFEPAEGSGEKPDHLVCELEFVAMLLVMLARARTAHHLEARRITEEALRAFAADHLGEWLVPFCARLNATAALRLHQLTAYILASVWRAVTRGMDLPAPVAPETPAATCPQPDEASPCECGLAEGARPLPLTIEGLDVRSAP
jgi:TorA maturation chaperone TorD